MPPSSASRVLLSSVPPGCSHLHPSYLPFTSVPPSSSPTDLRLHLSHPPLTSWMLSPTPSVSHGSSSPLSFHPPPLTAVPYLSLCIPSPTAVSHLLSPSLLVFPLFLHLSRLLTSYFSIRCSSWLPRFRPHPHGLFLSPSPCPVAAPHLHPHPLFLPFTSIPISYFSSDLYPRFPSLPLTSVPISSSSPLPPSPVPPPLPPLLANPHLHPHLPWPPLTIPIPYSSSPPPTPTLMATPHLNPLPSWSFLTPLPISCLHSSPPPIPPHPAAPLCPLTPSVAPQASTGSTPTRAATWTPSRSTATWRQARRASTPRKPPLPRRTGTSARTPRRRSTSGSARR